MSIEDRLTGSDEPIQLQPERKYPLAEVQIPTEALAAKVKAYLGNDPGKGRSVLVTWEEHNEFWPVFTINDKNKLTETFSGTTTVKPVDIVRRALNRPDIKFMDQDEQEFSDGVISLSLVSRDASRYGLCQLCLSDDFLKTDRVIRAVLPAPTHRYETGRNIKQEYAGKRMRATSLVTIVGCDSCGMRRARVNHGFVSSNSVTQGWTGSVYKTGVGTETVRFMLSDFGLECDSEGYVLTDKGWTVNDQVDQQHASEEE